MDLQEAVASVLVVDDNPDFQSIAANVAELAHCAATSATTLCEARRLARDERSDLILIGSRLPDGDGVDLLEQIDPAAHGEIAVVTETHCATPGNNKRRAARALGITAKTIYNRLLRYRELGLIGADQLGEPED